MFFTVYNFNKQRFFVDIAVVVDVHVTNKKPNTKVLKHRHACS